MRGMSRESGATLEGLEHLSQSVRDILTTAVGTRVIHTDSMTATMPGDAGRDHLDASWPLPAGRARDQA